MIIHRQLRRAVAAVTILGIIVGIYSFQIVQDNLKQAQNNHRGGPLWLAKQLEFELLRFNNSLALFALGETYQTSAELNEQFDVLWSRWNLSKVGSAGNWLTEIDGSYGALRSLENALVSFEDRIVNISSGDQKTALDAHAAFASLKPAFRDLSIRALDAVSQSEKDVRNRLIHGSEIVQVISYGMVLVSLLFAGFFYLDAQHQQKIAAEKSDLLKKSRAGYRAKSEFISTINHELRTPLTSMSGSLSLLKVPQVRVSEEKTDQLINLSIASCERLGLLVNRLLDLESYENGRFSLNLAEVDIQSILSAALEECQQGFLQKNVNLVANFAKISNPISGDAHRLQQALKEVLENAAKFSDETSEVTVNLEQKDFSVQIIVEDKGRGIPDHMLEKVFERFTQVDSSDKREFGGVGNGLFIAKTIVEAHKGTIHLKSKEGEGTLVCIELPKRLDTTLVEAA